MVGQDMPLAVTHLFTVAVIGSEHDGIVGLFGFGNDLAKFRINRLDRLFGSLEVACMPHHITIGKIDHDKIIRLIHGCAYRFADLRCGHLRFHIIGFDIGTGDKHTALPLHRCFNAAVKEECHMGILLRLCRMQLTKSRS